MVKHVMIALDETEREILGEVRYELLADGYVSSVNEELYDRLGDIEGPSRMVKDGDLRQFSYMLKDHIIHCRKSGSRHAARGLLAEIMEVLA